MIRFDFGKMPTIIQDLHLKVVKQLVNKFLNEKLVFVNKKKASLVHNNLTFQ